LAWPIGFSRCSDVDNTELNNLTTYARRMAHMARSGSMQRVRQMRGPRASAVIPSIATGVAVLTVLVSALAVRAGDDPFAYAGRRLPAWLIVVGLSVVGFVVAGLWATRIRPGASGGLATATIGSLLPLWAAWSWLPDRIQAGVLVATPFAVMVAQVALSWSAPGSSNPSTAMRIVVILVVASGVVHLLGYNPFADSRCRLTCVNVTPLLDGSMSTRSAVVVSCSLTIVGAVLAAIIVLKDGDRHTPRLIIGAVFVALCLQMVSAALRLATWADSTTAGLMLVLPAASVAIVGIAVCVIVTRTLRVRTAVDRLAARLSGPVAALSGVQGVHFAVPGEARWVDVAGRDATDLPGQDRYVVQSDESGPVLRLLVARGTDQGDLLAALTPATRLALQNAQLSAVAKARLADVHASQRRVVAMSDSERRRIERDLHDGAQQRLVSVAFHLKVALAGADPSTSLRLAAAESRIREALGQLRRLAHGIFPSVLADEGLASALDELIAASDVPTTLDVRTRDDVGMETAMAAYATVAAVLNSVEHPGPDTRAVILVERDGDTLTVSVEVEGAVGTVVAADLVDAADRVGALGGRFTTAETATGAAAVTAVIPCGS
jgi:signal transduction histidine kinase